VVSTNWLVSTGSVSI